MTYLEAKAIKKELDNKVDTFEAVLKGFEVKGSFGLVPDEIRKTPEYRNAKLNFDKAFKELQQFNKFFVKEFKKELTTERRSRRVQR